MNIYRPLFMLLLFVVTFGTAEFHPVAAQVTVLNWKDLPEITPTQKGRLKFIEENYFGLSVENYNGDLIGRPFSKRGPWIPIGGYRLTLTGRVSKFFIATGHNHDNDPPNDQDEYDWNIDIVPNHAFLHGADLPESACMNCNRSSNEKENTTIECEVTPDPSLRNLSYIWLGRQMCLYGPYVSDWGNDDQREIHPVEAIWWQNLQNNNDVIVLLVQDASRLRFHEYKDFDFDINNDYVNDSLPGWKLWVENPMKQTIKIPFEFDLNDGKHLVVDISQHQQTNVTTALIREIRDSNSIAGFANHKLKISTQTDQIGVYKPPFTVVEINKIGDAVGFLGVRFSEVYRSADGGKISGYIKILTALGQTGRNDPYGHQLLEIKKRFVTEIIDSNKGH